MDGEWPVFHPMSRSVTVQAEDVEVTAISADVARCTRLRCPRLDILAGHSSQGTSEPITPAPGGLCFVY